MNALWRFVIHFLAPLLLPVRRAGMTHPDSVTLRKLPCNKCWAQPALRASARRATVAVGNICRLFNACPNLHASRAAACLAVLMLALLGQQRARGAQIYAWGENGSGQCNVPAGIDFVAIDAGNDHSIALKAGLIPR